MTLTEARKLAKNDLVFIAIRLAIRSKLSQWEAEGMLERAIGREFDGMERTVSTICAGSIEADKLTREQAAEYLTQLKEIHR